MKVIKLVFMVGLMNALFACSGSSDSSGDGGLAGSDGSGDLADGGIASDGGAEDGGVNGCVPLHCEADEACVSRSDGCGGWIECGACPEFEGEGLMRHIELPEVQAGRPFAVPIFATLGTDSLVLLDGRDPERSTATPPAISLVDQDLHPAPLDWNDSTGLLSGTVEDPGVYRFRIEVCTVVPYDEGACALQENRRRDLVHLPVVGPGALSPVAPPNYSVHQVRVDLPVKFINDSFGFADLYPDLDPPILDEQPTLMSYPVDEHGAVVPGVHPIIAVAHGNGYYWNWYEDFSWELSRRGFVVIIPQYPFIMGPCTATQYRLAQAEFAWRWLIDEAEDEEHPLHGHLDSSMIVMLGHSWGGAAVQWDMMRTSARMVVVLDPISMVQNVPEWRTCEPNVPPSRLVSIPVLTFNSLGSAFSFTPVEHRGFYNNQAHVHVGLRGATHEDFLDVSDHPVSTDEIRSPQVKDETAEWIWRMSQRYVRDDLRMSQMLFGHSALEGSDRYPLGVHVAARRLSAHDVWVDRFAEYTGGSGNLVGGTRVIEGAEGSVRWPGRAQDHIDSAFDSHRPIYEEYFGSPSFNELHLAAYPGEEVVLREELGSFNGEEFSALAFEVAVYGEVRANEWEAEVFGVNFEITLRDGNGAEVTLPATAANPVESFVGYSPQSYVLQLAGLGINLSNLAEIELRFPPSEGVRNYVIDDVRFVY